MLIALTRHNYTFERAVKNPGFDLRVRSYHWALAQFALPRATYIFTDFDRLGPWELELAARLQRALAADGVRTLNNPARALQRYSVLHRLHAIGFNRFRAWRADEFQMPDVFPVFLRTQAAHRGVLTDLLETVEAAEEALRAALDEGYALRDLMFVEYCAEPVKPDLFRKLSCYRVGDRMISGMCVHEAKWAAKYGTMGIAGEDLYADELDIVATNRFGEALRPAFEAAAIDYGRADFAIVDGRPQVYEINTNPHIAAIGKHPSAVRLKADKLHFERLFESFSSVDTIAGGKPVQLTGTIFERQRRHEWLMSRDRLIV